MININLDNKSYIKQIKYVFDYLLRNCNIDFYFSSSKDVDTLSINYIYDENMNVDKLKNSLVIVDSGKIFNRDYLQKEPHVGDVQNIVYNNRKIYSLFNCSKKIYIDHYEDRNVIVTNIDIISDIFYMLTRYEEYFSKGKKDDHGRYKFEYSILNKHDLIEVPIVDNHYDLFKNILKTICTKIKFEDPSKMSFISHDVDNLQKYYSFSKKMKHFIKGFIPDFKKKKNILKVFKKYFSYKEDPYWMFDNVLELEDKYDIKSTYYLLLDENERIVKYNYNLLLILLEKLKNSDNETGLHAGYETSDKSQQFEKELKNYLELTNKEYSDIGCRQHYLKFDVKKTWDIQNDAGIKYDTSLAFPERVGFRAGTSKPFKVFSLVKNKRLDLWEIPLTVMDVTLFSEKYMNLSLEEAFKKMKKIIRIVENSRGVFSFLVHNSVFNDYSKDLFYFYKKILNYLNDNNCVNKSGLEITDIYK